MAGTTTDDHAPRTTTAEAAASTVESSPSTARRAPEIFLRLITAIHSVLPGFVRSRLPVTFIGYAIINGSAFFLDITCLWVFYNHLHWFYPLAVTVGYVIAAIYSFLLNRWLNFQAHGHVVEQGAGYTAGVISQYVIFILGLSSLLHWFYPVAVTVGYAIAAVYSFLLNRWLNFQAHGHVVQQGAGYMAGVVSQYVIFILGLSSLLHWFGVNAELARVISACCEGIYLYVFIRLWVFRGVPEPEEQSQ